MDAILLTDKELAEFLKVNPNTIRGWKFRKQIPPEIIFKLPNTNKGTVRYIKSKVEAWVNGTL